MPEHTTRVTPLTTLDVQAACAEPMEAAAARLKARMLVAEGLPRDGMVMAAEQALGRLRRVENLDPVPPRLDMALLPTVIV
ncbi:hypothetical protein [Microvirga sp. BSC39]|uniref:hypothetical protein n=1 Tax=Microvirga sp. BSC39 TaxID=1549810 RepID=UPI0004E8E881|nr:hypothetical protein [Microvirga sp. BSC39]KFG67252.1 hypothetical protein JH26_24580 [Microvirga sp. BSC39]